MKLTLTLEVEGKEFRDDTEITPEEHAAMVLKHLVADLNRGLYNQVNGTFELRDWCKPVGSFTISENE